MDSQYRPLQREADRLQYRCHDFVMDHGDPTGRQLEQAGTDVREDIERNKAPKAVEERILGLERQLNDIKSRPNAVISPDRAATLLHEYEDLRRQLRQLPNYNSGIANII